MVAWVAGVARVSWVEWLDRIDRINGLIGLLELIGFQLATGNEQQTTDNIQPLIITHIFQIVHGGLKWAF